jgi:nucleoid-associated protein YgaU
LASAKEVMDRDLLPTKKESSKITAKEINNGLPIAKTIGFNEEPIKIQRRYVSEEDPVEAKQLLTDLIATADCDANSNSNRYVTNLLKEVTHSKVKVMRVGKEYTTIRVRSGDSLSKLAARIYGDRSKFRIIYNANRDVLSNPNRIYAGLILKIPTEY